jgi:hypothetical protein
MFSAAHSSSVGTPRSVRIGNPTLDQPSDPAEYLATLWRPQTFSVPVAPAALVADVVRFRTQFLIAEDGPQVTSNLLGLLSTYSFWWRAGPRCKHRRDDASPNHTPDLDEQRGGLLPVWLADHGDPVVAERDWHAAKLRLTHVFFPLGFVALVRAGSPDPAVRPTGGFQVTRRRSGTRSARVSWTRHSAERRSPRDALTVGGWESCGRRGRGGRRPLPEPTTGRDCSSSTTSVNHRGPPSMSRRVRYQRTEQMGRKMYRNVEKRGVHTARNGPSPPPTPAGDPVAKAEMSTADRLGSREGLSRAGWRSR